MAKRKKVNPLTNKTALVKTVGQIMGKKVKIETGKPSVLKSSSEDTRQRLLLKEKKALLDAYNRHGFHVFQNFTLLQAILPNKSETEIRGIVDSYIRRSQSRETLKQENHLYKPLHDWQSFISRSISNFDKKINLDEIYTDVLRKLCDHFTNPEKQSSTDQPNSVPTNPQQANNLNYSDLYSNFIQLLEGKFPLKPSQMSAALITRLFNDLKVAGSHCASVIDFVDDGAWFIAMGQKLKSSQEIAGNTLAVIEASASFNDLKSSIEMRTLYREFPKISRITKTLNPLYFPIEGLAKVLSNEYL